MYKNEYERIVGVDIGSKCLNPSVSSKVLIMLGQTGAGKSTLINAIVNYIFDIKWEDSYRFVLIPESKIQTQSQTQWITAYTFHLMQGSKITFNLTIIDTPGFGDTQGLERDKKLVDQIRALFSNPKKYGFDHLDGIALAVKAHDTRLTQTQLYIFNAVMSLFGKDVANNIFIMATHADGGKAKVFEALHEAGIPCDKKFVFNNSALFTPLCQANPLSKMFWKMGVKSIQEFVVEFQKMESQSLVLTKQVLKDRKQLEVSIEGLQQNISEGIIKLNSLRQEKKALREHKECIDASKNWEYTVVVPKQRLVNLPPGEYVTNCLLCNRTCHHPCTINVDNEKHLCAAMKPQNDPVNAACTICPGKCHWEKHKNNPYKFETYVVNEKRTFDDLKKRYDVAVQGKEAKVQVIDKIASETLQIERKVFSYIAEAHSCIQNLDKIALKPNPLSQVQYIELLIEAEKSNPQPGWDGRVQQLEKAKQGAILVSEIKGQTIEEYLKTHNVVAEEEETDLSDDDDGQSIPFSERLKNCRVS